MYKGLSWKTLSESEFDAELLLLEFFLDKHSIFFDIGSNKGEYAFYAEKLIDPKQIYLFEPEVVLNKQLNTIFKGHNIYNIALSDVVGTHQFKIPLINGVPDNCLSSLEVDSKETNETSAIVYEVKTDTLDHFCSRHQVTPTLIKIDVEGHELSVLKGAQKTIENHQPTLIIEIEQRHHKNIDIESVFANFENLGYSCYYYSKKLKQLLPYTDKQHLTNGMDYFGKKDYINNYVFIHKTNKIIFGVDEINQQISIKTLL